MRAKTTNIDAITATRMPRSIPSVSVATNATVSPTRSVRLTVAMWRISLDVDQVEHRHDDDGAECGLGQSG